MGPAGLRPDPRLRRFGWLLALALWLPAAQWFAATHAFTHLRASAGTAAAASATAGAGQRDLPLSLPDACELCVLAAALGGGGAPATSASPVLAALPAHAHPAAAPVAAPARAPRLSYRSRAPPFLPV